MYLMRATLTEDLLGCTINVDAVRLEGRREIALSGVTWFCEFSEGMTLEQHAEVQRILDRQVSELSQKLRRVFPGVFFGEVEG